MRSVVSLRRASVSATRLALGATVALAVSFGCSVDQAGLAGTAEKLQRDGGGTGGVVIVGSGGDVGSGGSLGSGGAALGTGGNVGDGGTAATGGTNGSGGIIAVG